MYIVTELCQDGDLYRLLQKKRKLSEAEAKNYLKDIMNGAKYLHKNGIIHRDWSLPTYWSNKVYANWVILGSQKVWMKMRLLWNQ